MADAVDRGEWFPTIHAPDWPPNAGGDLGIMLGSGDARQDQTSIRFSLKSRIVRLLIGVLAEPIDCSLSLSPREPGGRDGHDK